MALKTCDPNGIDLVIFSKKSEKIIQRLRVPLLDPFRDTFKLHYFAPTSSNLVNFEKTFLTFGSSPSPSTKS